jgi:hypothetical protein
MKKRVAAVMLCCLCLIGSVQAFASAAEQSGAPPGISFRWSNLWNITLSMSYSGGSVSWVGQIAGNTGTSSISATYTLEKQNANGTYSFVSSWNDSTTSAISLASTGSATTAKGTYRLSVSAVVKNSAGTPETATNSLVKTFS